ncbi:hypothetical protein UR09_03915 [Candidatus Nitromaritima sp. SCGC AAA799-A02]|nr:hypothetical protein UR09_03915 [Candidatus Nitromaritima sp. SCGC AAA799-A02]KMP11438.1 hypothetical protein UZ36_04455 [Candidatus Nitromaritima sp. SCGC AAA799-C22]
MRCSFPLLVIVIALFLTPYSAFTEENGGDIWYKDTKKLGPVLFSHDLHLKKGNQCADCHDGIFQKKAGTADTGNAMTMKSLRKGKFCGTCHDGDKAFTVRRKCKVCHIKTQ